MSLQIADKRSHAMMFAAFSANNHESQPFVQLVEKWFGGDGAALESFLSDLDRAGLRIVKSDATET